MPAAVLPDLENPSRTIPDSLTLELYRKMLTAFLCRRADEDLRAPKQVPVLCRVHDLRVVAVEFSFFVA